MSVLYWRYNLFTTKPSGCLTNYVLGIKSVSGLVCAVCLQIFKNGGTPIELYGCITSSCGPFFLWSEGVKTSQILK